MNNNKHIKNQSGFTLVEVMIAMVILAIGLLALASAFTQGAVILANTPTHLAAKELANAIIDNMQIQHESGIFTIHGEEHHVGEVMWKDRRFRTETNIVQDASGNWRIGVTVIYEVNGFERRVTENTVL